MDQVVWGFLGRDFYEFCIYSRECMVVSALYMDQIANDAKILH